MSAPNLMRVGTAENIFVECQDCPPAGNIPVKITVMNHPTKNKKLAEKDVLLNNENNFQGFGKVTVSKTPLHYVSVKGLLMHLDPRIYMSCLFYFFYLLADSSGRL